MGVIENITVITYPTTGTMDGFRGDMNMRTGTGTGMEMGMGMGGGNLPVQEYAPQDMNFGQDAYL